MNNLSCRFYFKHDILLSYSMGIITWPKQRKEHAYMFVPTIHFPGNCNEALAPQFWSTLCGSVEDRFGVNWHIAQTAELQGS